MYHELIEKTRVAAFLLEIAIDNMESTNQQNRCMPALDLLPYLIAALEESQGTIREQKIVIDILTPPCTPEEAVEIEAFMHELGATPKESEET
jgi:hypothetical protein